MDNQTQMSLRGLDWSGWFVKELQAWVHICVWMWSRSENLLSVNKGLQQGTELLLLATLILKVSSLPISKSSKDSFQPLSLFYLVIRAQSSTVGHQSADSGKGGASVSPRLSHPCLQQPLRDSWDRPRRPLALTLHRETLSFGPVLQSYPLMPCKCPLHHIRRFSSNSLEMGR